MATALLSSPQARARNSPHDRLCWWYFALFVLKIEFYVGFAFSSPNLKAIKKCDSNFWDCGRVPKLTIFPARKRAARHDASNFHPSSCTSWALQAFAGDGAGSGAWTQRAKMTTNCLFLLIFVRFWYLFRLLVPFPSQPKTGDFIRPSPVVAPFLPCPLWFDVPTCTQVPNSYRYIWC